MRLRRPLTVSTATAALVVAAALPAGAHPAFTEGATAPANSLVTLTLRIEHGCASEDLEGSQPTQEVSLEVPDAFAHIEPFDVAGFEATTEGEPGAVPDVVTWTATDGGVPAPELPMEVVVDGDPGDELYVRVIQRCEGNSDRWVGTPQDPADDPAVLLTLTEPDPQAPPPPPAEEPPADESATGEATTDEPAAEEATADESTTEDATTEEAATSVEELPTEPPGDDTRAGPPWPLIVLGAVVLAGLGALLGARRRPVLDPSARDEPGTPGGDA